MMREAVIVSGARTPFGKFGGALQSFTASQLGGKAIEEALKRAEIAGNDVDEVIIGNVLQGGQGQIPSRRQACNNTSFTCFSHIRGISIEYSLVMRFSIFCKDMLCFLMYWKSRSTS